MIIFLVLTLIIVIISSYAFIKLCSLDKFFENAKPIKEVAQYLTDDFCGSILLVDKDELLKQIDVYKKIHKKANKKANKKETLVFTYDLKENEMDVKHFEKLKVKFVPCVINIENELEKKYTSYKVEEYLK